MKIYRYCILLFALTLISLCVKSENDRLHYQDSLLNNVQIKKTNSEEWYEAHIKLIEYYRGSDLQKALSHTKKILHQAQKNKNKKYESKLLLEVVRNNLDRGNMDSVNVIFSGIKNLVFSLNDNKLFADYYLLKSVIENRDGKIIKSIDSGLLALKYFSEINDEAGLGFIYNNIGVNYVSINSLEKGLENFLIAKKFAESSKNPRILSVVYSNIGAINMLENKDEEALFYLKKALEVCNKSFNNFGKISPYINIGSIYSKQKKYNQVLEQLYSILNILRISDYKKKYCVVLRNLGYTYLEMKQLDSAKFFYKKSALLSEEINDTINVVKAKEALANLYFKEKNMQGSKKCLQDIFLLAKSKKTMKNLEKAYLLLGEIEIANNNYKMAYKYLEKAKKVSDSLNIINVDKEKGNLYKQVELKDKINSFEYKLNKSKEEYTKLVNRQMIYIFIMISVILLLLIAAFLVMKESLRTKKRNENLMEHTKEMEEQKKLIEISNIELQEQYTFSEILINSIPNPIFYTSKRGDIIGCNDSFSEIVGKNKKTILNTNIKNICESGGFDCYCIENFVKIKEFGIPIEDKLIDAEGSEKNVFIFKQEILDQDKKSKAILGIIIDITEIKEAEKKVKEALDTKNKFFNIMAHDLKNPFNGVLGLSQLLSGDLDGYTLSEIKQYAELINQSAIQIYNLLENLLEWARAQTGSIQKKPVDFLVKHLIIESIEFLESSCQEKQIEISYEENNLKAFADKNMVQTAIRNILANAIKFTPEKGSIKIVTSQKNKFLKISIADTGVGIPKENLEQLFDLKNSISTEGTNKEKGTGLGLVISKEFITANDGTIEVESEVNKGTNFIISLPINKNQ